MLFRSIHEMPEWQVRPDLEEWVALTDWLDSRRPVVGPPLVGNEDNPALEHRNPVEVEAAV